MKNKSIADILFVAFGPIGSAMASLGLVFILSWSFDPQILAIVAIIELIALFFVMALTFGFDQGYVREYAEVADKTGLFASAMIVPSALCITVGVSILLILYYLDEFLLPGLGNLGNAIALTYGMSSLLIRLLSSCVRMSKKSIIFSSLQTVQRSMALIAIVFCILFTDDPGRYTVATCYLVGALISLALHAAVCHREILRMVVGPVNSSQLHALFRFGWPTAMGAIFYTLLSSTDRLSLAFFATDYDLGVYSVAVSIAGTVGILTLVFGLIWAPMVYEAEARGADRSAVTPYLDIVVMCVFFAASLIAATAWLVRDFLPPNYMAVAYYVPACMSLPVLYILAESFGIGIALSRKTGYSIIANAAGACVAVSVSFSLVPLQGASGAAFAILVGSLVFLVVRAELSAMLWYQYPRIRMYIVTFVYCSGCVVSLWFGTRLGWLFPVFWLMSCAVVLAVYFSRVSLFLSTIQEAGGSR